MITYLDLLVLVVMAMVAVSLVAVVLMFLVKNKKVKRICLYLAAALSLYVGYVGLRILWPMFLGQSVVAILAALTGIGAVVLERLSKDTDKKLLTAQILASASLVIGLVNAFMV